MGGYEWLIGTRYLRSTHRRGFVSFVALMSVCGLTLGVATLIVVLSVMNGFERELRSRILAVTSHATIMGLSGALPDWRDLQQQVRRQSGVQAAVPYVESQAMLAYGTILGSALAHELNARVGDSVVLIAPAGTATPTGVVPRMRRFRVVGLFQSGMYEFDRGLALVHMADAARLFQLGAR